ncbi:MAG: 2-isopropylmalate synthase [Thiohalomonadales bacterium]
MQSFDFNRYRPAPQVPLAQRQWPNKTIDKAPRWASVDLRDGNQALIEPMNVEQKRRLWALLLKLGFKEIEVGFPAASQADYDFVRWLIDAKQIPADVTIQVLVQARETLIKRTFEAVAGVDRAIVHVYNSTSTVQRERVFALSKQGIADIAIHGAEWLKTEAKKYPGTQWTFEYSPESFTSTEMDFAIEVCDAVIDVWRPTPHKPCIINLPSTVEVATANVFADQVEYFIGHVKKRDSIIVSVHTHNDRGCAVSAAELALMAGADRVEGTLLGNGERTGNMDIVTMAMNLYSQGIDPELDLSNPDGIISVVTECTGITVHPRHPWIGELVYTAFSGSHQDAIRKCLQKQQDDEHWQVAYLPIDPKDLGRDYQAVIRVNSQSGKGGIAYVMERDYGLRMPRWLQIELATVVQKASEVLGGEMRSEEIYRLFREKFVGESLRLCLRSYQLSRNQVDIIHAEVSTYEGDASIKGEGEGAISAFVDAWQRHSGRAISIVDYSEHAVEAGTNAEAVAYIQLNVDGQRISGVAFDHDTVSASLNAVLAALNTKMRQEEAA